MLKRTALVKKPPRPRKCPIHGGQYTPRRAIQPTCGAYVCEVEYAHRKAGKRIKREKYIADLERRGKAGLLKPHPLLLSEAQAAFNAFIRLRDDGLPCPSCGEPNSPFLWGGQWDCGHFLSVGSHPELRFEPLNAARQCKKCNGGSEHRRSIEITVHAAYRVVLIERIGLDKVEWLEGPHEPKRYRAEDLLGVKKDFQLRARELRRARKAAKTSAPVGGEPETEAVAESIF